MADPPGVSRPVAILPEHECDSFACGEAVLDDWLRRRAIANQMLRASSTYVVTASGALRVVGYYSLAMGHILNADAIDSMRRNMPQAIPAVIFGRLAVDRSMQSAGLGSWLLNDAVMRILRASAEVTARLIVVHPLSDTAAGFYSRYGFVDLPVEPRAMALDLRKLAQVAAGSAI